MPDHTTASAAAYLTEHGYTVRSKRDGTENSPSAQTVKQWCERGKIKARKAGWAWLIDEAILKALIASKPKIAQNITQKSGSGSSEENPLPD